MKTIRWGSLLFFLLAANGAAFGQAFGTISGRITDSSGAVVPQAKVTVTNTATALARETQTNINGLYSFSALDPGTYDVKAEQTGFAASTKTVALLASTTFTVDFQLGVGTVSQKVSVEGEAPLMETTQSEVSGTLQTSEVQSLPILNRNFTGLAILLPGARPAPAYNPTKNAMGAAISVGGGTGKNLDVLVDGADNKDDIVGGALQNYTIEGIEEFKIMIHDFSAEYGQSDGSVLQIVTKSGTNQLHGSAFGYGRNAGMTAIDYLTKEQNLPKTAYSREQFGGSLGGPIEKDRWFIFGAVERVQQDYFRTNLPSAYAQELVLNSAIPSLGLVPAQETPQPFRDNMYTIKSDYHINNQHSLFVRWAQQWNNENNDVQATTTPDLSQTTYDKNHLYSIVASETWIINNNSVNTFMVQRSNYTDDIAFNGDRIPDAQGYYQSTLPVTSTLIFPSMSEGKTGGADQLFVQEIWELEDNYSKQMGKHSLKYGAEFSIYPFLTVTTDIGTLGSVTFFDNPSTIVNNTNGKYPKGFLTPGIVSAISQGTTSAGGHPVGTSPSGQKQFGAYVQDDWKVSPTFTLNLGLRYDVDINWLDQSLASSARSYQVLEAIGSPYAVLPHTSIFNVGPRAGFAWDINGKGRDVLRVGFGIFVDQSQNVNEVGVKRLEQPTLQLSSSEVNTSVGVGQLATYVYGVSPLPPGPPAFSTSLPAGGNTSLTWYAPGMTNPYNEQTHVGYSHQFSPSLVLSTDYTHILGLREFRNTNINPLENFWDPTDADQHIPWGTRRLAPALQAAYGDPNRAAAFTLMDSVNRSQFNELDVHLERRASRATFQATYTFSTAYGFGGGISGSAAGANSTPAPQNPDQLFGPGEWGPSLTDERNRLVLSGVFALPLGIQASPLFQIASARPYTLTQGTNCSKTGTNNDRLFELNGVPAACEVGTEVGVNFQRGTATWDLDARVSKIFNLWSEKGKLALFAEFYNITNKANFGNNYNGNFAAGAAFEQPTGYLAGLPTSRQLQLGGRFSF